MDEAILGFTDEVSHTFSLYQERKSHMREVHPLRYVASPGREMASVIEYLIDGSNIYFSWTGQGADPKEDSENVIITICCELDIGWESFTFHLIERESEYRGLPGISYRITRFTLTSQTLLNLYPKIYNREFLGNDDIPLRVLLSFVEEMAPHYMVEPEPDF